MKVTHRQKKPRVLQTFHSLLMILKTILLGCSVYIDDILVHGEDLIEHNARLDAVMARLNAVGAKLNKEKCKFAQNKLHYLGHIISSDGLAPDNNKITAALSLPPPTTIDESRRLLGMVNYLQKFSPSLSTQVKPIRDILKGNFDLNAVNSAWHDVKSALRNAATTSFRFYNTKSQTAMLSDASPHGLGACLLQRDTCSGEWRPVMSASRSFTSTEEKYSQMERELLSIVFGATRFRQFILGGDVEFWTDHKPLEVIWTKPFDDIPPRLQRMMLRLAPYGATVVYKPAKEAMNRLADSLSRKPMSEEQQEITECEYEQITAVVRESAGTLLFDDFITIDDVAHETLSSNALNIIIDAIENNNWSNVSEVFDSYFKERHNLTVMEKPRLLLRGNQIVIPSVLRERLVKIAHDSHLGVKGTISQLSSVWWPGITADAKAAVSRCEYCIESQENLPNLDLQPSGVLTPWPGPDLGVSRISKCFRP